MGERSEERDQHISGLGFVSSVRQVCWFLMREIVAELADQLEETRTCHRLFDCPPSVDRVGS